MKFNNKLTTFVFSVLMMTFSVSALGVPAGEAEVRRAAERVFADIKAGRYEHLYDSLPSSSRQRVSRENFISALRRSQSMYKLDRMEVTNVRVSGDFAVADTVMYGHIYQPIDSDGKIVAQQYLVKEDGAWRVATGDRSLIEKFLAQNPEFAKKFPIRRPKIYIKRDGEWTDVSEMGKRRG